MLKFATPLEELTASPDLLAVPEMSITVEEGLRFRS